MWKGVPTFWKVGREPQEKAALTGREGVRAVGGGTFPAKWPDTRDTEGRGGQHHWDGVREPEGLLVDMPMSPRALQPCGTRNQLCKVTPLRI